MAEPLEWNRYQVFVENRSPAKFSDIPGVVRSLNDRPSKSPIESGCRFGETYEDDKESSRKLNTSDAFIGIISFTLSFLLPRSFASDFDWNENSPPFQNRTYGENVDEQYVEG